MVLPKVLKGLKARLDAAGAALAKIDPRAPRERDCNALVAALEGLQPLLGPAAKELRMAAGAGGAMTGQELWGEAHRLARPCVWLRPEGPADDFAAVWGGPGVVPPPKKGAYRHWLTVGCWSYKEFLHRKGLKVGPAQGCLSVYTDEGDGGVAVHDPRAKLTDADGGARLYAHAGRCMPPLDAVFRFGSPAVQKWLKAQGWDPKAGPNGNFKDRTPVDEYQRHYQELSPVHGSRLGSRQPVYAMLGGWHFPWPDGDWAELVKKPLLALTFEDAEPWVEVWGKGKGFRVVQRIT